MIEAAATPVPFIGAGALMTMLLALTVLLASAIALGWLARRIGLPAVVGEILAGVILGPSILGQAWPWLQHTLFPTDAARLNLIDAIGQLGVILLVGLAGAELDLAFVRRRTSVVTSVGVFAFVVPLAAGIGAGFLIPASMRADDVSPTVLALLLGTALSVSAIPVIAKILTEMGLLHRNIGQLILAVGSTNDAVAWVLLSVTSSMATVGLRSGNVAAALIATVGAIGVAVFVLKPLIRPLLDKLENTEAATGYLVPVCATLVIACAAVTQALNLEAILGAFLAGVVIGPRDPPHRAAASGHDDGARADLPGDRRSAGGPAPAGRPNGRSHRGGTAGTRRHVQIRRCLHRRASGAANPLGIGGIGIGTEHPRCRGDRHRDDRIAHRGVLGQRLHGDRADRHRHVRDGTADAQIRDVPDHQHRRRTRP